jgi:hypothetical protein
MKGFFLVLSREAPLVVGWVDGGTDNSEGNEKLISWWDNLSLGHCRSIRRECR